MVMNRWLRICKYLAMRILLAMIIAGFLGIQNAAAQQVVWEESSWRNIEKAAEAQQKPIFLYVYAPYCEICKHMQTVLNGDTLGPYLSQTFVTAKMDSDNLSNNIRLSNWGITIIPSYLVFDPKGKKIGLFAGEPTASSLKEALMQTMSPDSLLGK